MDRLPLVMLLWACAEATPSGPPPSRFEAVMAKPVSDTDVAAFCDETGERAFAWPPLDAPAPAPAARPRWVNVWATWCGPCVAEMPMLASWQQKLAKEAVPVDLVFVSVDDDPVLVERFAKQHPDLPPSLRVSSPDALGPWLAEVGLDPSVAIPIHLFLDRESRVRCVRAGALDPAHYPMVKALLDGA